MICWLTFTVSLKTSTSSSWTVSCYDSSLGTLFNVAIICYSKSDREIWSEFSYKQCRHVKIFFPRSLAFLEFRALWAQWQGLNNAAKLQPHLVSGFAAGVKVQFPGLVSAGIYHDGGRDLWYRRVISNCDWPLQPFHLLLMQFSFLTHLKKLTSYRSDYSK